jgi:hypothetical protein
MSVAKFDWEENHDIRSEDICCGGRDTNPDMQDTEQKP